MPTATLSLTNFITQPQGPAGFDVGSRTRIVIALVGITLTSLTLIALTRGALGFAPSHPNIRELAIALHVTTVLPAIPLGAYLLLAPKGGKRHKQLGKLWIGLMLTTAGSAIFIQSGGSFSFIHIFIPMTFWASYKVIKTARSGDMVGHKKEIMSLYLGALTIPGIVAFSLPGRLMNVWLFW
ncbi:DUF2306 domain-containing protein [Pontixanthobacter aestiaquae]|uniref:DUF2306 domain-containing protein n=1 Tax=Pontixanthobacter aestiaquae TaxID=1509367 RepID=A0A844Z2W7_9SPHN|nr:DUF2306 domain-containing protein [Pontixanthobacter aestiaquae]MDN3647191.1 DUF2306 domain-containing protein [Pontixanthobacter aestiaquae]MXO81834.1 DUF2306 domain-containing protein [Pontixanthobacter aestiaquae]